MTLLLSCAVSFLCESDSNLQSEECGDCPGEENPSSKYVESSRLSWAISEIQDIKQSFITRVERKSLETALILVAIAMTILVLGSFIQWWRKGHPVLTDYILLPHEAESEKLKQCEKQTSNSDRTK